ncbi:hypothetical protein GX917_00795 [Candidatus Falkowbacteria bacterium]|jgi:hypothetical protein|nr:hypothetical protein [Candidatus Falkowbacteria bacterium]
MINKFLKNIGLTDKEAAIYLELLRIDKSSVLNLSKKTNILRTSIYPILDTLLEKGLVSEIKVGKKTYFQAEPPERIGAYIESQKIRLEEQSLLAGEYIPQLKSLSRQSGEKPIVKIYEGREGIFLANEESFGYGKRDKDDIAYFIYPFDLLENLFSEQEIKKSRAQRIRKKIKSQAIYTYSKGERPASENSVRLKVDYKKYPIKCDVSIFKDTIKINTLSKSLSSLVIKSQDIADTLKSLFEIAFDSQKKEK